jgi:hypothetical protein
MNITVLSIQPGATPNSWDVILTFPDQQSTFTFTREPIMIRDREGWAMTADPSFYETFKFNQHITHRVNQLLRQVIEQQTVTLSTDVGVFYTPEEAQAEMARRRDAQLKAIHT